MKILIGVLCFCLPIICLSQDPQWSIVADKIDANRYYGITVANGMIGIVSSAEPLKVKDVVLNGVYDYYQRGRVSNILKTFNHVNMNLDVDGRRLTAADISVINKCWI
jgi:hypothetical protein